MGGGWYDDERMMAEIGKMKAIADQTVQLDKTPVSEIAMIVDDASLAYMQVGNRISIPLLLQQIPELGKIGAPFSYYALDDIENMPEHKMYVFVNCFAPTEKQRKSIDRIVKCNNHVALWIYAPGFIRNGKADIHAIKHLTGMDIDYRLEESPLKVVISGKNDLLKSVKEGLSYGTDIKAGPVFYAGDNTGEVIGRLEGYNLPGLVIKKCDNWTSVYSSAPNVPSVILRDLASLAGVNLYVESDDIIYANKSLLSLTVNEEGRRTIRLPQASNVYDLFEDKYIGKGVNGFWIDMPSKSTKLWRIEPK